MQHALARTPTQHHEASADERDVVIVEITWNSDLRHRREVGQREHDHMSGLDLREQSADGRRDDLDAFLTGRYRLVHRRCKSIATGVSWVREARGAAIGRRSRDPWAGSGARD